MGKFKVGDKVKHKDVDIELEVNKIEGAWVTCNYKDPDGLRVEKTYDENVIILIEARKVKPIRKNIVGNMF